MQFVRDVAAGFMPSWLDIARRNMQKPHTEHQRQWQLQRRGAYVCFNLLYDRGVRFGAPAHHLVCFDWFHHAISAAIWRFWTCPVSQGLLACCTAVCKTKTT